MDKNIVIGQIRESRDQLASLTNAMAKADRSRKLIGVTTMYGASTWLLKTCFIDEVLTPTSELRELRQSFWMTFRDSADLSYFKFRGCKVNPLHG